MDQPGSFQTDLGAFDLSYDAGFATISSSSSYTSQSAFSQFDLTGLIESLAAYYGNYPRTLSPILDNSTDKAFTEELRFVSKNSGPWDWVAGAYYSDRKQTLDASRAHSGFCELESNFQVRDNRPAAPCESAVVPVSVIWRRDSVLQRRHPPFAEPVSRPQLHT